MTSKEKAIEEDAYTERRTYQDEQSLRLGGMNEYIMFDAMKLERGFILGAKSEAAKEFHQQGMYSEDEVRKLLKEYFWWQWKNEISGDLFEDWFEENKKK